MSQLDLFDVADFLYVDSCVVGSVEQFAVRFEAFGERAGKGETIVVSCSSDPEYLANTIEFIRDNQARYGIHDADITIVVRTIQVGEWREVA